ncbi:hypothetical protein MRX96_047311 [Rhipicephalus microplus]
MGVCSPSPALVVSLGGQGMVCLGSGYCSSPDLYTGTIPEGSFLRLLYSNGWRPLQDDFGSRHPVWMSNTSVSLMGRRTEQTYSSD